MPDTTTPPTLTNRLGTISGKIFAAHGADEFNNLMEEFRVEHRNLVLAEAAARQRATAQHLDEYGLAAAEPLLVALADTIDPTVQGMFVPARVRDAAAGLLAARTTAPQEG